MIELRGYQKDLLARAQTAINPDKARVMMQLPTGGGKTVIAAHLLREWLAPGRKAVWITHRKELVNQTRGMLSDAGISAYHGDGWSTGTPAPMINYGVIILMAPTVGRRIRKAGVWKRYSRSDLMIIDEAHHAAATGWERAIRLFPGKAIGMTATPWRLSEKEGFDHIFRELTGGPQVADLQREDFLCRGRVFIPAPDQRIQGGEIGSIGDYTEGGIERANQLHPDIMTAGVLKFWQQHASDRQTIIYAVSVGHAYNLKAVFEDAGIPAGIILGATASEERADAIREFANGSLSVLVNVAVATEGFDLPDASCVVIARPTQSLALYLQMVGRGLRPKSDGGDCLILDLAGNSMVHGLPEEFREWSLAPRGSSDEGDAPVVRCEHCDAASPAASHNCQSCGAPFGEDCQRCGKWRAWSGWILNDLCEYDHDTVCDRCHRDAHIQNELPVTDEMNTLAELEGEDEEMPIYDSELDDRLAALLREMLEEERRRVMGAADDKRNELREFIETRQSVLSSDSVLNKQFDEWLANLPPSQKPESIPQQSRMYVEWEGNLKSELAAKRNEMADMENQVIDKQPIFYSAQARLVAILRREAEYMEILSDNPAIATPMGVNISAWRESLGVGNSGSTPIMSDTHSGGQSPLTQLYIPPKSSPDSVRLPSGDQVSVNSWTDFIVEIANWLIQEGKLTRNDCPVRLGRQTNCFINTTPYHPDGREFGGRRNLLDGMYAFTKSAGGKHVSGNVIKLLRKFGEDPAQVYVKLRGEGDRSGGVEYRNRMVEDPLRGQRKFADRLRRLRHESGLSQRTLADLSGVSHVSINRIEAAAQSPKSDTIQRLAAAMGYPVQALLMDDWREFSDGDSD